MSRHAEGCWGDDHCDGNCKQYDFAESAKHIQRVLGDDTCTQFSPTCGCICILPLDHPPSLAARPRCGHGNLMPCADTIDFDVINKAQHYNSHPSGVEAIDIARHLSGDWFNAFKYVFRADHKNGRQDVEKSIYYVKDSIAHGIPIFAPTYRHKHQILLQKVIDAETDPNRIGFFAGVMAGNQVSALGCARSILEGWDA